MEYDGALGSVQHDCLQIQTESGQNSRENMVEEIQGIIEYEFKNPSLLVQAFTHCSYLDQDKSSTESNERLEYVGDAVLDLLIAKEHYFSYPGMTPGRLTTLRAANVDKEKLARVALKHELHKFMRHKKPLLDGQIKNFGEAIVDFPLHSGGVIYAPKALADLVEALIGAIYLDSDCLDTTWKVVEKLLQPMITPSTFHIQPVTMLQEICQKNKMDVKCIEDSWEETGEVEYLVDGEVLGKATYSRKRSVARYRAAKIACYQILEKLNLQNKHERY